MGTCKNSSLRRAFGWSLVVTLASGCAWLDAVDRESFFDRDGDGSSYLVDCDNTNPNVSGGQTFYTDADDDGFGDDARTVTACALPDGTAPFGGDCDDDDAELNPNTDWYLDADGDGFGDTLTGVRACVAPAGYVRVRNDCDDANAARHPGVAEACNGLDDDCDGAFDDADEDIAGQPTWYADLDHDGFGDLNAPATSCIAPAEHVSDATDCDDDDRDAFPGGVELCDTDDLDEDCDGDADDDDDAPLGTIAWYLDADSDGYGSGSTTVACDAPSGHVDAPDDCDDAAATVHPSAAEIWYDGVDQGCDGGDDDDQDADGFADEAHGGDDCDDLDPDVNPGEVEAWYDGIDADCNGGNDFDQDGDTHDISGQTGFDCDDENAARYPGATEFSDGLDSDCDGKDWVCGSLTRRVPEDYADISKAIAPACDGDTILLAPGQWPAPTATIVKRVTLAGAGIGATTLIATSGLTTLRMDAGGLRDLTVRGQPGGRAVDAYGSLDIAMRRVLIDGAGGEGVDAGYSDGLLVTDSAVENCSGGGIGGSFPANVILRRTSFTNNAGVTGAGIAIGYATNLLVDECVFRNNSSTGFGGAVALDYNRGNVRVSNSRFENNRAQYGSGVYMRESGVIENCEFSGNTATNQGTIRVSTGDYTFRGLTFTGDNGGAGGQVLVALGSSVDLEDIALVSNLTVPGYPTLQVNANSITARGILAIGNSRSGMAFIGNAVEVSELVAANNGSAGVLLEKTAGSGTFLARRITSVGNVDAGISIFANVPGIAIRDVITAGNSAGFERSGTSAVNVTYCASYDNDVASVGMSAPTCVTADPRFVTWGPALTINQWDLHLAPDSTLIDAGTPSELDVDGTRADLGAYLAGTDLLGAAAWMADDDADGMYDGWEVARGLNPTTDDSTYDPDSDTLDNGTEFALGTHPGLRDSDGDTFYDADEATAGTDPLSPLDP